MKTEKMKSILVLAGLALAWTGVAWGDLSTGWTGEKEGAAKVSSSTSQTLEEEENGLQEGAASGKGVTSEEYMAAARAAAEEAAVDELSRQMVDGLLGPGDGGESAGYGDSTLPGGRDDIDVHLGGVVAARGGSVKAAGGTFKALDTGENYAAGKDWATQTGLGEGFGDWTERKTTQAASVTRIVENKRFQMQSGEAKGEIAMVRPLDTQTGLESGEFTVTMRGTADEPGDFVGFAVYGTSDNELFRWGYMTVENGEEAEDPYTSWTAFSRDGGQTFEQARAGVGSGDVNFTLTWRQLGGGMMEIKMVDNYGSSCLLDDVPADRVMAIAALLTESGINSEEFNGTEMEFDSLRVTGIERAVPEPGVLGLLAAGAAALWRKRGKAAKGGRTEGGAA